MRKFVLALITVLALGSQSTRAQISPGELSKGHQHLEGISNCSQCHESGKELSGAKCLTCHTEIKKQNDAKRGFHYLNAASMCMSCHKDHLGKDARVTKFEESQFDHAKSGFSLSGKHAALKCEQCHTDTYIKSPEVQKGLSTYPHKTFLGLDQRCISCHADRHRGSVSTECQSCHGANAWSPAGAFDHGKTKYALAGRHVSVDCAKCHEAARRRGPTDPILFGTKPYADCTPCHASPHGSKFSDKTCRSCHSLEGWSAVKSFNHSGTRFALTGKHTVVACVKCHTFMQARKGGSVNLATKEFRDCKPCHTSPHGARLSAEQCMSCHNATSWAARSPLPFDHSLTQFKLEGKHGSLKCEECHKLSPKATFTQRFMLQYRLCTNCHADYHKGQFAGTFGNDCARCHTEKGFKPSTFTAMRHADTKLPLLGAHAAIPCVACHTQRNENGAGIVQYKEISAECQGCHKDVHGGQFARNGETPCAQCHSPVGWHSLLFNHDVQSSFPLTGAHKGVQCRSCHKEERLGGQTIVRFKPLSSKCEFCHQRAQ
jgi:hypothetical protein